jgi:hypothetical protein
VVKLPGSTASKPKAIRSRGKVASNGMLREGTPIDDYREQYGLWVKREDLACLPPGPQFSKTRGVYARIAKLPHRIVGVLDTYHSQAGHAVARACQILGKHCINYYPDFKYEPGPREPQLRAEALGAELVPLKAGRSSILFHQARKLTEAREGYMMPNALKLEESVEETAKEVKVGGFSTILIPASSGTITAGVVKGFGAGPRYIVHLGYSRSHDETLRYIREMSGVPTADITLIDECYSYKDKAADGATPPWPCNEYYDLKAFRWWIQEGRQQYGPTLFWNIG